MDKPLRGPVLTEAVQQHVKNLIIRDRLQPGGTLPPETQLAVDLGVSRNSVREAIKALQSMGIVEVRHGNGIFVRGFNLDSVLDLLSYGLVFDQSKVQEFLQIRKWLEVAAVGEVMKLITESDLAAMDEILSRWEKKLAGSTEGVEEEDRAFHAALFAPLRNQSLTTLVDIFWALFQNIADNITREEEARRTALEQHRAVVSAIRKQDVALASQAMSAHFDDVESVLRRQGLDRVRPFSDG